MYKKRIVLMVFLMLMCLALPAFGQEITLNINGKIIVPTVSPEVRNGTMLVPARVISEELNAQVDYQPDTQKIIITKDDRVMGLQVGSMVTTVNNQTGKALLMAPQIKNGNTTMVPLRFIAENLNCQVYWNQLDNSVNIVEISAKSVAYANEVVRLINVERQKNGLNPLEKLDTLTMAAQIRARESQTKFAHTRPDGRRGLAVLDELGVEYQSAGENIAISYATPEEVVVAWMASPAHKANILKPEFTYCGVGAYLLKGNDKYSVAQLFIT